MQAEVKTVQQLFCQPVQYVIPLFQRSYGWDREQQWEPLWEDVRNMADTILEADPETGVRVPPHFMGALVLQQEPLNSDEPDDSPLGRRPIVVDGQQRLTTLQVLARSIVGVADDFKLGADIEPIRQLIANLELDELYRYKVLQSNPADLAAYQRLMYDPTGNKAAPGSSLLNHAHGIEACNDFFTEAANRYLDQEDPGRRRLQVLALRDTVAHHIETAVLTLADDEQPNMVFETLNARGQSLAQHDLVKNTVMMEAGVVLDNDLARKCWNAFDDQWWTPTKKQNGHLTKFLTAWLTPRCRKSVPNQRISTEFRAFINHSKTRGDNVWDIFDALNHSGRTYRNIVDGGDADFSPFFNAMQTIGASENAVISLCLWMLEPDNGLQHADAVRTIPMLESYAYRRALIGRTPLPPNVTMSLVTTLTEAVETGHDIRDKTRDHLTDAGPPRTEYWPDDDYLAEHLLYNKCLRDSELKIVLVAVENHLRRKDNVPPLDTAAPVHLLSLIPPAEEHWQSDRPWAISGGQRMAARRQAVQRIGNYTILPGKASDRRKRESLAWPQKRELLQESAYHLNRQLAVQTDWDEAIIQNRSRELAQQANEIWVR